MPEYWSRKGKEKRREGDICDNTTKGIAE